MQFFLEGATFAGRNGATVRFATALGIAEVTICRAGIVRLRLVSDDRPAPSYLLERDWEEVPVEVRVGEPTLISTASLTLGITTTPFRVFLGDVQNNLLLDRITFARKAAEPDATPCGRVQVRCTPIGEQHFYGLGHGGQQFDRLGGMRQLWNSHVGRGPGSDIAIPLVVSNRGYAIFFNNTYDARLAIGQSDTEVRIIYDAEGGPLDVYLLVADSLRSVLNEVAELLGRPILPPRWLLGYLQSTRHFHDIDELRRLPQTLRTRRIPCDGLIFLSTYGDALGWNRQVGSLDFQPDLWPDPAGLLREMHDQHFAVLIHEYPVLHPKSPLFPEASRQGYLLAEGYPRVTPTESPGTTYRQGQRYLDFSNPDTRIWWWQQHRHLVEAGVDGWWLDGGEGPPSSSLLHGGSGEALHNVYDLLRQQAFSEGETTDRPDRRPVLLCRSGGAGMQRFGAACWSGDVNNTFATLAAQIPLGLNTGMSGVPYWGTDIGGFFHPVPETGELFVRWFQFGAFCPIFRSHGHEWREHLPWAHGEEIEQICRAYAELRYRLLPYTYSLAWQARMLGLPLMRPLVLNYPDDPRVWELDDEYLWGDDILVAPVTREGTRHWTVYLPRGGWYDFWTQERYVGPRGVEVEAPLDRLPLFIREGAIIPTGPVVQCADEMPLGEVTVLVYPSGASRFELYEDDGRTNAYQQGAYALTMITCHQDADRTIIEIAEPSGDSRVLPSNRCYILQIYQEWPSRVEVADMADFPQLDSPDSREPGWWHDGTHFLFVRLPKPAGIVTLS
jgi:alpha-glucosidase